MAEVVPPAAAPKEKSTPIPARDRVCGLPLASSVIASEAEREPIAVGLKITLMVQFAPAATVELQVFV